MINYMKICMLHLIGAWYGTTIFFLFKNYNYL